MNENKHKIDMSKLTPEQREKLDSYNQATAQIKSLKDIADLTEGIVSILEDQKDEGTKTSKEMGSLLMDMRDSLTALSGKEMPEMPDHAKPVVEAVSKLEAAIAKAIKSIDVKPVVNVDAPQVHLNPTEVDLKGIEKILKTDIPKAFKQAIEAIPVPPVPDNKELLQAQKDILDQLEDIARFTSKQPSQPTQIKVINPDGTLIYDGASSAFASTVGDSTASDILINSNPSRKEVEFTNTSTAILYLLKGVGTASTTNYTVKLATDDYYSSNAKTAFAVTLMTGTNLSLTKVA